MSPNSRGGCRKFREVAKRNSRLQKKFDRTPQKKAISTRREFVVAYTELLEQPLQLWTAIVEE